MADKVIITCALTGVLTDPKQHPVPVTIGQMATSAQEAFNAGAAIVHLHYRQQAPGKGHLPSWDPNLSSAINSAIRGACPGIIINQSTGTVGRDQSGPLACIRANKPEIAACNAGSLNYLKVRANGTWAWPPIQFQNPVDKIEELLAVLHETGSHPEFECFDTGIVRSVGMFQDVGMVHNVNYNLVMGVDSGMPADADLLPILINSMKPSSIWQTTLIGRQEIWPVHRKTAELGGNLRTGLEDTFYLPDGSRARSNGELVAAIAKIAEESGRKIASPQDARKIIAAENKKLG